MENGQKSTINERILILVEKMGGPSEVAKLMGIDPQFFYNLKNRPTSQPNSKSLDRFFEIAPRANANYIYKGVGPMWLDEPENGSDETPNAKLVKTIGTGEPEPPRPADAVNWKGRYFELSDRYNDLEAKFNVIVEQVKGLTMQNQMLEFMYKKLDPSFLSSSSHTTAIADMDEMLAQYKDKGLRQIRESFRIQGLEPTKVRIDRVKADTIVRSLWNPGQLAMSA